MARLTLWFLVVLLGLDLGAGIYEARVVVPLWSRDVPATLQAGNPFGQVALNAGVGFWAYLTSAVAIAAILALGFGLGTPMPERAWRTVAAGGELLVVGSTLLYFRPTLVRLFMGHGAGMSSGEIATTVQRWVMWSRVRIVVSLAAWICALCALGMSAGTGLPVNR